MNLTDYMTKYNIFCDSVSPVMLNELEKDLTKLDPYDKGIYDLFMDSLLMNKAPTSQMFLYSLIQIERKI